MIRNSKKQMWIYITLAIACSAWGVLVGLSLLREEPKVIQLEAVVMEGDCYFDDVEGTLPCYFMKK